MNWLRIGAMVLAGALVVGAGSAPAAAGVPTDQLKGAVERVLKTLDDPSLKGEARLADRRAAVRKIANEIFDFGETARRSLGRHWQARTPAEREEFVQLFTDLLERSYISRVELYGGEKIQYLSDVVESSDQARVLTRLLTKGGGEIPIEYRMHRKADRWLVYDVIIEGVSLVSNYRTQFNKVVQTESYEALVQRLKERGAAPAASPGRR